MIITSADERCWLLWGCGSQLPLVWLELVFRAVWLTAAAKAKTKWINLVAGAAATTAILARSPPQRECTLQLTHSNAFKHKHKQHNNNPRLTLALSPAPPAGRSLLCSMILLYVFAVVVARICLVFVRRCEGMQVKLILMCLCFYGVSCVWKLFCVQVGHSSGDWYKRNVTPECSGVSKLLMQVVELSFSLCALI